jgi:GT2 family glycosyltransferase
MPIVTQALAYTDLPSPSTQQQGWCWIENTELSLPSETIPNPPQISIVIPSYNQGQFIEETIRSVLLQGYPNLELIIMDGGSTDNTIQIIERYAPFISIWVSEPDRGQSHAVNKGIQQATGDLIGWQNSDDFYQPGTFWQAARAAIAHPKADIFFGGVSAIDETGQQTITYPIGEFSPHEMLPWSTNLFNQCMVIRRQVFDRIGLIDESYRHCMDYDLFWRMVMAECQFQFVPGMAACFRHHHQSKGATQNDVADREFWQIYKQIYTCQTLPKSLRNQALECLRSSCAQDFTKNRRSLFRQHVQELQSVAGLKSLTPALLAKYILSFLDNPQLQ